MAYKIVMECDQTHVGPHSVIGYRSGDQLPVGHPDVGPSWRPVIVEVPDDEPEPEKPHQSAPESKPELEKPHQSAPASKPEPKPSVTPASQAKTGVKQP